MSVVQMICDPGKYPSMWGCISGIYKAEGIPGLWRGNMINCLRIAPQVPPFFSFPATVNQC